MSIFAMRVERTDDRPHIWPGSESRSNYSQTAPVTAKPLVFFIQSEHGGEQRTPLKGCVRVRSPYTAEQCSPMFAVRPKCSPVDEALAAVCGRSPLAARAKRKG
jgi:hypothetical protein